MGMLGARRDERGGTTDNAIGKMSYDTITGSRVAVALVLLHPNATPTREPVNFAGHVTAPNPTMTASPRSPTCRSANCDQQAGTPIERANVTDGALTLDPDPAHRPEQRRDPPRRVVQRATPDVALL